MRLGGESHPWLEGLAHLCCRKTTIVLMQRGRAGGLKDPYFASFMRVVVKMSWRVAADFGGLERCEQHLAFSEKIASRSSFISIAGRWLAATITSYSNSSIAIIYYYRSSYFF